LTDPCTQISEAFSSDDWSLSAVVENCSLYALDISHRLLKRMEERPEGIRDLLASETGFHLAMLAARAGNEAVVKLLMEFGLDAADLLRRCRYRSFRDKSLVKMLLRCGADPETEVARALLPENLEVLQLLRR